MKIIDEIKKKKRRKKSSFITDGSNIEYATAFFNDSQNIASNENSQEVASETVAEAFKELPDIVKKLNKIAKIIDARDRNSLAQLTMDVGSNEDVLNRTSCKKLVSLSDTLSVFKYLNIIIVREQLDNQVVLYFKDFQAMDLYINDIDALVDTFGIEENYCKGSRNMVQLTLSEDFDEVDVEDVGGPTVDTIGSSSSLIDITIELYNLVKLLDSTRISLEMDGNTEVSELLDEISADCLNNIGKLQSAMGNYSDNIEEIINGENEEI